MNVWSFTGNIGKDCETRTTPGNDVVVTFSVAVKSGYGDKAVTTWANCAFWGKRAEAVSKYLGKGQLVGVSGEVTLDEYTDKDGAKRNSLKVRVNDLTLLGKADRSESATPSPSRNEAAGRAQRAPDSTGGPNPTAFDMEDDIPFAYCSMDYDLNRAGRNTLVRG